MPTTLQRRFGASAALAMIVAEVMAQGFSLPRPEWRGRWVIPAG
ncbi:MAG: hypothetical protein U0163_02920 [Gemmatimonadaceae bacterium]